MPGPRRVATYPWSSLERVPRKVARRMGEARRRMARAAMLDQLGPSLSELLASEVTIVVRDITLRSEPVEACRVGIETADGEARALIGVEPSLAVAALARLLGRNVAVGPTGSPLDPSLSGALGALLIEAARRTHPELALRVAAIPSESEPGVSVLATVLLDGRPYEASAIVWASASSERPIELAALGDLPIALPLVVSLAVAERSELARLSHGSAWLPADGWWIDRELCGRGVLSAPGGDAGIAVEVSKDGGLVVRGSESLLLEVETMSEEVSQAATEAALDAPIVVRVEMGAVSMTAREWARLGPGDVIETGKRVASPVTLRVAGRVVARGELVDVDGELGVRIRELATREGSP